jgi:hypothetical protein
MERPRRASFHATRPSHRQLNDAPRGESATRANEGRAATLFPLSTFPSRPLRRANVGYEAEANERGERYVWLEEQARRNTQAERELRSAPVVKLKGFIASPVRSALA